MNKMVCFDMDGTIADLYGVNGWLEYLQAENPWPYLAARPMCDMDALRDVLLKLKEQGWEIRVISWLAKDSSEAYKDAVRMAAQQKPIASGVTTRTGTTSSSLTTIAKSATAGIWATRLTPRW